MNNTAILVRLRNVRKHPNADKLQLATILGTTVVVGLDNFNDELGIYFDSNLQLSEIYCKENNLFRKSEFNKDINKTGFVGDNRRVRAIKLRGEISNGLFSSLESTNFLDNYGKLFLEKKGEGFEFTELGDTKICEKYIVPASSQSSGNGSGKNKHTRKVVVSRIIGDQFRYHFDTDQLPKNLHRINPDDICSLSVKLHGTSSITSNCMVKRKLNIFEKLLKKFLYNVVKIQETEFDYIYSSRKVIKNGEMQGKDAKHYYGYDLWLESGEKFKGLLHRGETVYYEIVGFTKTGGYIQNGFDYKCDPFTNKIYIYRITQTTADGIVVELQWKQLKERCNEIGFDHVPEIYYGKLKDLDGKAKDYYYNTTKETFNSRDWRDLFLQDLKEQYLEKDSLYCNNKNVPEEGVVLRKDGLIIDCFKYKADAFWAYEDGQKEKGNVDMEDQN